MILNLRLFRINILMENIQTIFNECNCMNRNNSEFNNLNGYKQKRTLGSFLPMCDKCLVNGQVKIKYRLTESDFDLSIDEITKVRKMLTFITKTNFTKIQEQFDMQNDYVSKWLSNLDGEESSELKIIECAKAIDLSLADIFDMAGKKNQLPCNIELVFKRPSDKAVIHKTFMSYQFCEFFYSV